MTMRERAAFQAGMNYYVPKMAYASNLNLNGVNAFSLGTPAVASATNILTGITSNATALTETVIVAANQLLLADSPYGRSIQVSAAADPGANGVLDVYGYDYLGQPMVERFTFVSGSTAALYGKKAFFNAYKVKIVTASANATTYRVGTGSRLGLPYKGDVVWVKENNVLVPVYNRPIIEWVDRAAAKAVAGGTEFIRAPFPGYVSTLYGIPAGGGGGTDPVVTVELGGTAITGLTVTVDTSDVAGLEVSDVPTTVGYNANNRFIAGGKIELVAGAAAGAFADRLGLELTPTQCINPTLTDPQTTTTGDPRGTYESLMVLDDIKEIIVGLSGDPSINSSGNGGLHGIKHVVA